jgi:hypothetical protein
MINSAMVVRFQCDLTWTESSMIKIVHRLTASSYFHHLKDDFGLNQSLFKTPMISGFGSVLKMCLCTAFKGYLKLRYALDRKCNGPERVIKKNFEDIY